MVVPKAPGRTLGQPDGTLMVCILFWVAKVPFTQGLLVVFAHQGYFTIFINPSGSTTYGQGQAMHLMERNKLNDISSSVHRLHHRGLGRTTLY
jgi:hypothetical protein